MTSSPRSSTRIVVGVVFTLVGVAMLVYFGFFVGRNPPGNGDGENESPTAELSPAARLDIYRRIRQANAAVEDEWFIVAEKDGEPISGYDYAERIYEQLTEELPGEELPIANLAISKFLYATKTNFNDPESFADPATAKSEAIAAAESALTRWHEVSPSAAAPLWLQATFEKWRQVGQIDDKVFALYQQAAQVAPDDAVFQYAVYDAGQLAEDESHLELARTALREAYRLAPHNLAIALALASDYATVQSPELLPLLESIEPDIAAINNQNLVIGTNLDASKRLDELLEKLRNDDWSRVPTLISMLKNLISRSEGYRSDATRLEPDALEFLVQAPSPEFMDALAAAADAEEAAVPVTFEPLAAGRQTFATPIQEIALADFDLDGLAELWVLTAEQLTVLKLKGTDTPPQVIATWPLDGSYAGMLIADLDRDIQSQGPTENTSAANRDADAEASATQPTVDADCDTADVDVVLWGNDGILILRNDRLEDGVTREFTPLERPEVFKTLTNITAARLVDIEHDADLDLVVAAEQGLKILLHLGSDEAKTLKFRDHTEYSTVPELASPVQSLRLVDWDRDVDADVLVADRSGKTVGYLEGLRHGRFQWRAFDEELPDFAAAAPLHFLEADGNASWDLIGMRDGNLRVALTSTSRAHRVVAMRTFPVAAAWADFLISDFDNDGDQDLIGWNAERLVAYRGRLDGSFAEDETVFPTPVAGVQHAISGDFDQDGDLDLVVAQGADIQLLSNEGGNANHWLTLRSFGQEDNAGRSNHNGLGSLIELRAGTRYQAQMMNVQRNHFGLGAKQTPDLVRTIWTNGMPQGLLDPPRDATICQKMYLKGSCPFIYTWTGERYEFLTDCLWAAPLGLQQAEGKLAPSRSWEYLKIPGERLQPIEGEYRLQLTEELWEAAYFDVVELICIDHPAEVEIFSNEKVGPPSIAGYKVHTVRQKRHPIAARDPQGQDVLEMVSQQDERFYRGFQEKIRQGLTPPHHIELDLGELDRSQPATLFLTGWIHPTDTSLNVAFSQAPEVDAPRLPELWVADGTGGWQAVPRPMGFPGGKTKTIAVDITDVFPTDDCRLQVRTSAEVYWDEIFFTVGEPESELETTRLSVHHADLHYRGFSARLPKQPNGPELFDYAQVDTEPKWPPMRGNFTRYGDVTELLHNEDDRMAILAAGDEMTVRFQVPDKPLRSGWKRDFFLYCVGWDKDADLNTIHGQTVEPLPHRGMQQYPYPPENDYPQTEEHRRYLREYQTRRSDFSRFWRAVSRPSPE